MSETATATQFWETRYADSQNVWSGRVNDVLAEVASTLVPGRALDLGCGEGGDAVWLAQQGWTVTGLDISPTAVARGNSAAAAEGISDDRLHLLSADLETWSPREDQDFVTCSFLHSPPALIDRELILRRAVRWVRPGGHLLVISHAQAPPWADPKMIEGYVFPTPESDLSALELDRQDWQVLTCQTRQRIATGPDGRVATVTDGVVLVERSSSSAQIVDDPTT